MGIPSSFNAAAEMRAFNAADARFDKALEQTNQAGAKLNITLEQNAAEATQEKLAEEAQENASTGMAAPTKQLRAPQRSEKIEKAKEVQESVLVRKDEADEFAGDFSRKQGNREYHIEMSMLSSLAQDLGTNLTPAMSSTEIIDHVVSRLRTIDPKTTSIKDPDPSQVDKAFEFLLYAIDRQLTNLEKTNPKSPDIDRLKDMAAHMKIAKDDHYNMPGHSLAIQQAQKIISIASDVIDKTGQTPKEMLDKMRDDINTPQDVQTKRKFYEQHGGYKVMITESNSHYHFIGESLKRVKIQIEGQSPKKDMPVLENAELHLLTDAIRVLQAATRVVILSEKEAKIIEKYLMKAGVIDKGFDSGSRLRL